MTTNKPTYMNLAEIARQLGYPSRTMSARIHNWEHHPTNPTPEPDAHITTTHGHTRLWLQHRLPEWTTWNNNCPTHRQQGPPRKNPDT